MSSRSLPKVLNPRKANSVEAERENFEKNQNISINKAINQQEVPVKEKHVRSAIIGTFSDKGAGIFWSVVIKLPLQGNPIVCWKFLHVVHKLLREGHPNVINDSQKFRRTIYDLGKLWGHLKEGYGKLICGYCKLLMTKLDFHKKNPRFPGHLHVSDEKLEQIGEQDVNNYFQMAVEMFDYMDDILQLQAAVFGSLDMSRSNSMTSSGQCRLAPLIPCIQDSSHLYDFCVKLLFKMHSSLPPDLLSGHRDRFYKQFKALQQFYFSSSNLQYFKYLIQIPLLPEDPPNFFVASDIDCHVSPVVILPPQADTPDREFDGIDMNLVDTSSISSSPTRFDDVISNHSGDRNDSHVSDGRDKLIEELQKEIINLQIELQRQVVQNREIQMRLNQEVDRLQDELQSLKELYKEKCAKNVELEKKLSEESESSEAVVQLAEFEKKSKANEEKFAKMKNVYGRLREEHISLLRVKAEIEKQLLSSQKKESEVLSSKEMLEERLQQAEDMKLEIQGKVKQTNDYVEEIHELKNEKMKLSHEKEESVSKLLEYENQKISMEHDIMSLKEMNANLEKKLGIAKTDNDNQVQRLRSDSLMKQLDILAGILDEASFVVKCSLNDMEDPLFSTNTCPPELLLKQANCIHASLDKISSGHSEFENDDNCIEELTNSIVTYSHLISQYIVHGKATSNTSPDIELGDEIASLCKEVGLKSLDLFSSMKNKDSSDRVPNCIKSLRDMIGNVMQKTENLVSKLSQNQSENIGKMLNDELFCMDKAIEDAASRIAELLNRTREADSGVKLEVNGKILDSCTGLMQAIKILVTSSKYLQKEIVDQGRGSASASEFYKRNHRWSEGFLSAAKEVGMGAKFLVEAADKVVQGKTKFEELVVASQEIAASTAQLVIASKVKADRDSQALAKLSSASKGVTEATGKVVATSKSCADLIEDSVALDFSKLSLHQAKRYEMESQVRVLELESSLQKERVKLAGLRKQHYQLAGPSEGWEDSDYKN